MLLHLALLAHPDYLAKIPNAGRVFDCSGTSWPAVGHAQAEGGGARNSFGEDFAAAGHEWTRELCEMDSDGDGYSNGVELGDPECEWSEGGTAQFDKGIRHPGGQCVGAGCYDSNDLEDPCDGYERDSDWRDFNATFSPHPVAAGTTYVKMGFTFPELEPASVVRMSTINLNPRVVHHMLLYQCENDQTVPPYDFGTPNSNGAMTCINLLYAWAVGGNDLCMPTDVGIEISPGAPYLLLEIHYDNPTNMMGVVDESGVRLTYIPEERTITCGDTWRAGLCDSAVAQTRCPVACDSCSSPPCTDVDPLTQSEVNTADAGLGYPLRHVDCDTIQRVNLCRFPIAADLCKTACGVRESGTDPDLTRPHVIAASSYLGYPLSAAAGPRLPAGVMLIGAKLPQVTVPAATSSFGMYTQTPKFSTAIPSDGANIFAYVLHMHQIGKEIWITAIDDEEGTEREVGCNSAYDFDLQDCVKTPMQSINQNTRLQVSCVWDSSSRNYVTHGGDESEDEMCIGIVYYYPAITPLTILTTPTEFSLAAPKMCQGPGALLSGVDGSSARRRRLELESNMSQHILVDDKKERPNAYAEPESKRRLSTCSLQQEVIDPSFSSSKHIAHGAVMIVAFGLLFPTGSAMPRWKTVLPGPLWFRLHMLIQVVGVVLAFYAFSVAYEFTHDGYHFDKSISMHKLTGLILVCAAGGQVLIGAARPHAPSKGEKATPQRLVWAVLHRLIAGYIVFAAIPQILSGIKLIKDDLRSQFYGGYASCLSFAFLVFIGGIALSQKGTKVCPRGNESGEKSEFGVKTQPSAVPVTTSTSAA